MFCFQVTEIICNKQLHSFWQKALCFSHLHFECNTRIHFLQIILVLIQYNSFYWFVQKIKFVFIL